MLKPLCLAFLIAIGLLLSGSSTHAAQNGKNNKQTNAQRNDERRENAAVQQAQKDVNAAEKVVREAEKSARQAAESLKGAIRDQSKAAAQIQKRRDDLEAKHADLVGLTEARRSLAAAHKTYEVAGAPILVRVAETAEYKAALETAKNADRQLAKLRAEADEDGDDRLKQMAEAANAKFLPAKLQRDALDAEDSLKGERNHLRGAEEAVSKAVAEMGKAVEKDPELKSAKEAFEAAKDRVVAARRESAKETRQMADARQKLAREQQDLQQKINADLKDDNRPKRNKK